jgi:hypothetical protein
MIMKVFLTKKILGDILVEYLGNISGKNLRGITGEIYGQYFWKELEGVSLGKYLGNISGKNLKGITRENIWTVFLERI